MVVLDHVCHAYPGVGRQADILTLDDINLVVEPGEIVSVLGPSGSGKSTLLNVLAGFERPARGRVLIDRQELAGPSAKVGIVFQEDTLFPWLTVWDNVVYGPRIQKHFDRETKTRAQQMLEEVGLSGFRSHYPFQLSGGMKQRAAIARVLVNQSEILLMDEPFGALDAQTRLKLQMLLIRVQAQLQKTVIFVTYDVDEALFISHRIVVLSARPARIVEILNVDQPHPQDMSFITSDQFSQLKQRVLFLLFGGAA